MTRAQYIRFFCGLSAREVGEEAGVSQQHISRVELRELPATKHHEAMICRALLRLIDRRIRELYRIRVYCKSHTGRLLENMEENEHE